MSRTQVIALVLTENDSALIAVVNRPSGFFFGKPLGRTVE